MNSLTGYENLGLKPRPRHINSVIRETRDGRQETGEGDRRQEKGDGRQSRETGNRIWEMEVRRQEKVERQNLLCDTLRHSCLCLL